MKFLCSTLIAALAVAVSGQGIPWNPSGDTSCIAGAPPDTKSPCAKVKAKEACEKAVNRWIDNGLYQATVTYVATSGDAKCVATFNCNSGGPRSEMLGKEAKNG